MSKEATTVRRRGKMRWCFYYVLVFLLMCFALVIMVVVIMGGEVLKDKGYNGEKDKGTM